MKHYTSPRIQRAQLFLMKVSSYLEIACALVLIVAICIAFIPVPQNLYSLYLDNGFDLSDFMKKSFDLVIGVELLKMFCRHDIDSIVEVLLFSPWQDRWSSTTLPSKKLLSAVLPLRSSSLSAGFSSYPFWIIRMSRKEN